MTVLDISYEMRARFLVRTVMEPFHFVGVCAAYQQGLKLWPRVGFPSLDAWERYLWDELARHDITPDDALDIFEFMFPAWYFEIENRWQMTYAGDPRELDRIEAEVLQRESKSTEDFRALNHLRLSVRLWATDLLPDFPPPRPA